ncbi:hypothetical protein PFICI_07018 [Pestalotiopsis fici W106-1]|uniref:Aspartate racemase n=1 Tax=Pestalotiopsis fici (strain W106-1 / CGMCC3.15140) TaxID=1229662 RepID=W3XA14_PESFW|nr:uncharacterized protein PFICI_07018 [Pestalotiopsis fici W106-1]ETS82016.1 hypothetical protein PFICI_07018 [Pestalotiopsis fici W106-1]
MKTIGIIGGLGWPSTAIYYQEINKRIGAHLGGNHCAKLIVIQADLEEILELEGANEWSRIGQLMVDMAERLKAAGADFFLLACNTMHKSLVPFKHTLPLPFLDIVDTAAKKAIAYQKVALIGSKPTMTDNYFLGPLITEYGLKVLVPPVAQQDAIQTALHGELVKGLVLESTKMMFAKVVADLIDRGAELIILGCTEFGMLLQQTDISVPVLETLAAHVEAAVDFAVN